MTQSSATGRRSPSPTPPEQGADELRAVLGALGAEAVLLRTGAQYDVQPGALRLLALIWLATRHGARGIATRLLYDLALVNSATIRKYLPRLTKAGHLRRTRATRDTAPLVYITAQGSDLVRRYILAQQRAERATARKLADIQ